MTSEQWAKRAQKLYEQAKEYHLKDAAWKANYRARLRRLSRQINPRVDQDHDAVKAIMYLDIAGMRTENYPVWKEE